MAIETPGEDWKSEGGDERGGESGEAGDTDCKEVPGRRGCRSGGSVSPGGRLDGESGGARGDKLRAGRDGGQITGRRSGGGREDEGVEGGSEGGGDAGPERVREPNGEVGGDDGGDVVVRPEDTGDTGGGEDGASGRGGT